MAPLREALSAATDALAAVGVESPRLDAELLLCAALGCERAYLAANPEAAVPPAAGRSFGELVRRRLRREPVAYILGRKGFRYLELEVDSRVLIPRPETELLVELALRRRPARVLDIGTGSGAIALAVAAELPECEVVATDTSAAALAVARANAERLGLAARVQFLEGSVPGHDGTADAGDGFDLVLSNLPYVAERDWAGLEPEVTQWEPRSALLAGPDGLDAIRALLTALTERERTYAPLQGLKAFAPAVGLEIGEGQAPAVAALLAESGFATVSTHADLAGIDRVVFGEV